MNAQIHSSAAIGLSGVARAPATPPLAAWLREETRAIHAEAETAPFHMELIRGRVSREDYGRYLGQLFWVHDVLEAALRQLAGHDRRVRRVLGCCQFHLARLDRDVRFLIGEMPPPSALTARMRAMLEGLDRRQSLALLGAHYVLEGSKNGGRILACVVRQALALGDGAGTEYFDPYGDEQAVLWRQYKDAMDRLELTDAQREDVLFGATAMFRYVTELCAELQSPRSPTQ